MMRTRRRSSPWTASAVAALVAALTCWSSAGVAAERMRCGSGDPMYWPSGPKVMRYLATTPDGDPLRSEVQAAVDIWNAVPQAAVGLATEAGAVNGCAPRQQDSFGVVGWDDGTCADWGPETVGLTVIWTTTGCKVTRAAIYFNRNRALEMERWRHVAIHELGHYVLYEHNWFQLSVMGYQPISSAPLNFLTGHDHGFARAVYGQAPMKPDLHIHRFGQRARVIPDVVSFEERDEPRCGGRCDELKPGDVIALDVTVGNTGAEINAPVVVAFKLGARELGRVQWPGFPAHHEQPLSVEVTVPADAVGLRGLHLVVDPDDTVDEADSSVGMANVLSFENVAMPTPSGWTCAASQFGSGDGCHCDCGLPDPDCSPDAVPLNCPDASPCVAASCNEEGSCIYDTRNGEACDDGLFCTVGDVCLGNNCNGTPRSCSGLDDSCSIGVCDESAGACVALAREESTDLCPSVPVVEQDPIVGDPDEPVEQPAPTPPEEPEPEEPAVEVGEPEGDGDVQLRIKCAAAGRHDASGRHAVLALLALFGLLWRRRRAP